MSKLSYFGSAVGYTGLVTGEELEDATPVSQANPLPIAGSRQLPAAWADGTVARDMRRFEGAELQVAGLSGGDTITVTRSLDGMNYVVAAYVDQAFATGTTISANGIYSFAGGGYLKWSKTGPGAAPTVTLRGAN